MHFSTVYLVRRRCRRTALTDIESVMCVLCIPKSGACTVIRDLKISKYNSVVWRQVWKRSFARKQPIVLVSGQNSDDIE